MHGTATDRRALEREALRNVINQWNANRLDLFELSEPNEDLEFHGVMRFYFQDSGQKVATKCIRVASDATVEDVIGTLVEKFRPDMRMLSVPSYALYELHEGCPERRMLPDEKPLLVQLNWHVDDREGRFLLRNIDDKTAMNSLDANNASFRRKLSKREKKQLKKQEKLSRMKSVENGTTGVGGANGELNGIIENKDGVAEKLYTELPETSFTRSISNPEAVMRRRRQQKLEKKLQQFRSKDGGPDTGGTLKIYGEALCKDVPYKTLLLSVRDCAGAVVREMLDKYGLNKTDPSQWCLVQVTQQPGTQDTEYVLDDDECPLSILMNSPNTGSIMFHVRRRPADCAPRKRKKKPGALGANSANARDVRGDAVPLLVELGPDGSIPHPSDTTARTIRLSNEVIEVGSANGIALQLYGPHIQPRHCVITNTDGIASLTPCHADAHTYVNGQRIHQTTILTHGSLVKFGHSNTYRFLDPVHEDRMRHPQQPVGMAATSSIYESRSPRALSPSAEQSREPIETTFDLEGNVETISTASGAREDSRSLGSASENNRLSGMDRFPRGQDPILPAVLEFPEEPQEQFLARVITHLDVTTPTFRLAPAYTLYLCARYRASTHYRPELTPTERAHKLTVLLQHAAMLIRHTVQDRSTESTSQAFWLANASELLHFLKSDRHVSSFSLQAQDTLADAVQLSFKNLVACLTDELNSAMGHLMSLQNDDHPREIINILSGAMNLLRKCRVNAALTIQLFSQLFHWISAKALANVISQSNLCTRQFGNKLFNRLRNLQAWAESQGLELAAECHLAKIVQCAHLMQAPKYSPEELAALSSACFKLNSMQLGALLRQYKPEPGEKLAPPQLLEQAAKAAESVADELARGEGREVTLYEDPAPPLQLLLPDDGFSCDVVQGVPPGLADFLHPLQASGLCRLAAQPTSSGHWTVYMSAPRPPSALSTTQPEVQVIRLHKAGGGMGLSIVAAKGAGQERLGIYIKSVVPGGAADRDGRLAAGDQLLTVDGQSLLGITQEKAAEFLVRTGSVVTLEVAKGGAVYHGLATLLQQPSPTPHRAVDFNSEAAAAALPLESSQESLCSLNYRVFTPPAQKSKNQVFFNSDDTLYKREARKLAIPRIEIESDTEPIFNLQVTDFSEPSPKNIILGYDASGTNFETKAIIEDVILEANSRKSWKDKTNNFVQQKSYSIDIHENPHIEIENVCDTDKFLSISANKKFRQKYSSGSLQDLSSSTSSINSCIHESNLDLSHIVDDDDPTTPIKLKKNWKSPDQVRFNDDEHYLNDKAISYPELPIASKICSGNSRSKSVSEEQLNFVDNKLTEYERMEVLKLLKDWSISGSESKSELNLKLMKHKSDLAKETMEASEKLLRNTVKFASEPNLSPKHQDNGVFVIAKYNSEANLQKFKTEEIELMHKCEFRNCIFNENFQNGSNNKLSNDEKVVDLVDRPLKSILKTSQERLQELECLTNITNLQQEKTPTTRRFSETINNNNVNNKNEFNSQLVRCDSLEQLNDLKFKRSNNHKKFPEAYIVRRHSSQSLNNNYQKRCNNNNNNNENKQKLSSSSPKTVLKKRSYVPKTWKSCSDIKNRAKTVRKCCRNAKKNCPILVKCNNWIEGDEKARRKTQSCAEIDGQVEDLHIAARLDAVSLERGACFNRPRRMSERDLPSRVDAERTIPSSKSVPALHHISPNSEQNRNYPNHHPSSSTTTTTNNPHDVFNPGYSRTSSNNSINTNSIAPVTNGAARSRSTHNLHQQQQQQQQQDGGFYQNLSIYRNKIPSPQQHLGDRTSALRSSQNSLQSSVAMSQQPAQQQQRPASAYYPPPLSINTTTSSRPNLHQSIPNLKSPPGSLHRLQNENDASNRSGSYPSVISPNYNNYGGGTVYTPGQGLIKEVMSSSNVSYPSPNNGSYSNGLLREDLIRQSQNSRHEEIMRYLSTNNARLNEQQQLQQQQQLNEIRTSRSEDALRNHANNQNNEMMRYASSGNVRAHESSKVEIPLYRMKDDEEGNGAAINSNSMMDLRRPQKLLLENDMRKKQRMVYQQQQQQQNYYQQQQQQQYYQQQNSPYSPTHPQPNYLTQSMQNMAISPQYYQQQQQYYSPQNTPTSPTTNYKTPPIAPKPMKKQDDPPELPPTSTHPLYSASSQEPPKMAFYPTNNNGGNNSKTPRDPWAREEQERQAEARREVSRQWQEQQIRELLSLAHRTPQQEEQLRVLQLEREFQRRAQEAAEQDDDDTEKEGASPPQQHGLIMQKQQQQQEMTPTSILKGIQNVLPPPMPPQQQEQQQIVAAPPPPERGSSFQVMSMRVKDSSTKRVSFDTSAANMLQQQQQQQQQSQPQPPQNLMLEETIREDPNSFIRQAEHMLASPTTPTDASPGGMATATPGVIGAQEVYRDPRARRLAEQAQQKNQTMPAVPEKLSFKEKMKMFAMETGEQETPKDKSKISKAQREIDNLASPSSGLVH